MAITSPAEAAKEVSTIAADYLKLKDQVGKLDKTYASKNGEWMLLSQPLWAGHDEIKRLRKELADAITTFEKMTTKAEIVKKQMDTIGKMAVDHKKELAKFVKPIEAAQDTCEKLYKLNKTSSLLKDALLGKNGCKDLLRSIDQESVKLEGVAQECQGLAKLPDLPK